MATSPISIDDVKSKREIADANGVEVYQVEYALKKLGITPVRRIGCMDLYSPEDVTRLANEFKSRRQAG